MLFREMVEAFQPPTWATTVIVLGDAGYGSGQYEDGETTPQ